MKIRKEKILIIIFIYLIYFDLFKYNFHFKLFDIY